MSCFKDKYSLKKRTEESTRIMAKYPNRIPIIVEKAPRSYLPDIDKSKYLVPCDLTLSQFMYVIRKRIKLNAEQAMYLFINKSIPAGSMLLSAIYKDQKNVDNFLYVIYDVENTFG